MHKHLTSATFFYRLHLALLAGYNQQKSRFQNRSQTYARSRFSPAFTIVELLIVIVVISILATLSIVAYNNITSQASVATLKSDLRNAASMLDVIKIDSGTDTYPSPNLPSTIKASSDNAFQYTSDGTTYCLTITTTAPNVPAYNITPGGIMSEGACEGHEVAVGGFNAITFEFEYSCGIAEGKAYCWGYNNTGQLGNNSTTNSSVPVAVDTSGVLAGKTITHIATGRNHACAVAEGKAYCWGNNGSIGALGNNSTTSSLVPVAVDASGALAGKTITSITAGESHTCVIADGQAYCWGYNSYGRLGDGTSTTRLVPTAVDTSGVLAGKTVTDISAGFVFTCAVADERAYCWGYNYAGDLGGGGAMYNNHYSPIAVHTGVLGAKAVTRITIGQYTVCVIADSQAYCWGNRTGDGTSSKRYTPVAVNTSGVLSGKTITDISSGVDNTCAIADSLVYCWGANTRGQIGNNSNTEALSPVAVDTSGVLSGKNIKGVAVGWSHSCAIASGEAYCWGRNNFGQIGNNSLIDSLVPIQVEPLP